MSPHAFLPACRGLVLLFVLASAQAAEPLSFSAALQLAERHAPELAARKATLDAAQAMASQASALPDPKLSLGIDNLPSSGPDRWRLKRDFMTMQTVSVMQELPNSGKRAARADMAVAQIRQGQAERDITRREVWRQTAAAWLNRYYLERKLAVFDELEAENKLLAETVRAQLAGGKGSVADVLLPRQEALVLAARRDELGRDLANARTTLRRWVAEAADAPLLGSPPALHEQSELWRSQQQNLPELAALSAGSELAQAQLKEAIAAKRPDWAVELSYQRRARQFGDMVSLQFSFDLPIFPASRQQPQIAAREAELRKIEADRQSWQREQTRQLDEALAEANRLRRAVERQQTAVQPLAEEKLSLLLASYQSGKASLSELLAARRERIEARLQHIELQAQYQQLLAQLHYRYTETVQ